ncbi:MAG: sugar nucleotide-binding protein [Pseudomonadales bacterium]|nr:sugar nucleotide-binding protein [Pseudomonadales bacterium]
MPKTIFATGINGLVGSHFQNRYNSSYTIVSLDVADPRNPVDITQPEQVLNALSSAKGEYVLHLAAFTNVTEAWKQNGDTHGIAYKVNVEGTKNIIAACQQLGLHLIHVSTAYVFDGENEDLYTEENSVHPIEWYGQTKAEAEALVMASTIDWTVLRIDQPFRSDFFPRLDIAHRILDGLKNNTLYQQFDNHFFGPTYIDDFSKVVDWVLRTGTTGLFNASSGEKWSDFEFATAIANTHSITTEIQKGDLNEYLKTLDRPYQRNTAMDTTKLQNALDFELTPISKAIAEIS